MTDTPQGGAAAMLARTKRVEMQHFADGGSVRRTAAKHSGKSVGAATLLASMPASHAGATQMEHGGEVRGPGGPTSDSVPIWASAGEFMLPADTTAALGKDRLEALVDATHTPTGAAAKKLGTLARADGGLIDQQPGAVRRVGNSYSGGNVSGSITVNGAAPGGTVSTVEAFRAPPPPPKPPVLGAPAAVTPLVPKPDTLGGAPAAPVAAPAATPAPAPSASAPPAPLDYANRNAAFNAGAQARTAMMSAPGLRRSDLAAAPVPNSAAAALATRPVQSIVGYADGGAIEDPRKRLTPSQVMATFSDAAGASMPAPPPSGAATAAASGGFAEIPRGRYESAAPWPAHAPSAPAAPAPAEQVQARRIDNALASAAAAEPTPPAPSPARSRLAELPAAVAAPVSSSGQGGLADTNAQLASLQASNASVPQGGATIIDTAAGEADRRAQFNEQANLRNALNSTVMTRRGAVPNEVAVQAALLPIDARARMAQVTAKEAGDTQRAVIQERGADARARLADVRAQQALGVDQQRLALDGRKVALDASREDRAAAAAETELAKNTRISQLQEQVVNGTPEQQRRAAEQLAALQGREITSDRPPAGYRRTADGNLEFIRGGPADPAVRGSRAPLNDTQAKALQFGTRMQVAGELLDQLAQQGVDQPGLIKRAADAVGLGTAANWTQSGEQQQVEQAQRDFINAVLRRESGAAISESEFDNARKQYFPQVGEDEKVIAQKRQNRELATRGILAEVPDADARVAQVRGVAPPASVPVPPQVAELQRRAANNPALAQRLREAGY